MYIYTYVCMYLYMCARMYVNMCVYIYVCIHVCLCTCITCVRSSRILIQQQNKSSVQQITHEIIIHENIITIKMKRNSKIRCSTAK